MSDVDLHEPSDAELMVIGSNGAQPTTDALPTPRGWPDPPDKAAFYGLAGEFAQMVAPHTEADRVGLLAMLLVMCGNAIGRRPYVAADGDPQHCNEFLVIVGDTSKSRKGVGTAHARRAVIAADPDWEQQLSSGLSSGEGLIYHVRDRRTGINEKGEEIVQDEGVADKRLLPLEAEFAAVLKVASRDSNTLSALLRQAWDSGTLRTLTRKDPLHATGAHISLIAHITQEELARYLDQTDIANGFANRFLFCCVRRSQLLPEGGQIPEQQLHAWTMKLAGALDLAGRQDEVKRDPAMRKLWNAGYADLSKARPGLAGALLARSEPHVLRLAMLYALLDASAVIQEVHLQAALALWNYCQRSVEYLFGQSTGDPDADKIVRALRASDSLTRTEINTLLGGHRRSTQMDRALALLLEHGLAHMDTVETGGRTAEVWRAR